MSDMRLHKILKERVERRHKVHFWGCDYFVRPRLVDEIFGDGQQLMKLFPLDTRPNYYVVRIGTGWIDSCDRGSDEFLDRLDEICEAIDDQFGIAEGEDGGYRDDSRFPEHHEHSGHSWVAAKWKEYGLRGPAKKYKETTP